MEVKMNNKDYLNLLACTVKLADEGQVGLYYTKVPGCYAFELYEGSQRFKTVFIKFDDNDPIEPTYETELSLKHDGTLTFEMQLVLQHLVNTVAASCVEDYDTITIYQYNINGESCEPPDDRAFITYKSTSRLKFDVTHTERKPYLMREYEPILDMIDENGERSSCSFDEMCEVETKDIPTWELRVYE